MTESEVDALHDDTGVVAILARYGLRVVRAGVELDFVGLDASGLLED